MMAWKQYILSAPSDGCLFSCCCVACICTLLQLLVAIYEAVMSTLLSMNVSTTNSVVIINEYVMMHDKLVICLKRVIGNRKKLRISILVILMLYFSSTPIILSGRNDLLDMHNLQQT